MTKLNCNSELFDLIAEIQIEIAESTGLNVSMEDALLLRLKSLKNGKKENQGNWNQDRNSRRSICESHEDRKRS